MGVDLDPFRPFLVPLDSRFQRFEERLVRWAEINSNSAHRTGLEHMAGQLEAAFAEWTPVAPDRIELPNGPALRWICRPDSPTRVFLGGHFDTVYPPDHPFQTCTRLDSNTLQGPGTADMKGGLLILLEALRAFESSPFSAAAGWEVVLTPDEEIGSPHSAPLLELAARRCDIGLVFEPALPGQGDLVRRRPGSAVFCLQATGRAAHVGRDFSAGRSAIVALCDAIQQLHGLNRNGGLICNAGAIHGGGAVNVVPAEAHAYLNVRTAEPETALAALHGIVARTQSAHGVELQLTGSFTRPPKPLTPEMERLFAHYQSCAQALGLSIGWQDTGGCCDGNNLAASGLPNLDSLGARGGNIHSPDEYVLLDSLIERARIAALLLMDWAREASNEQEPRS